MSRWQYEHSRCRSHNEFDTFRCQSSSFLHLFAPPHLLSSLMMKHPTCRAARALCSSLASPCRDARDWHFCLCSFCGREHAQQMRCHRHRDKRRLVAAARECRTSVCRHSESAIFVCMVVNEMVIVNNDNKLIDKQELSYVLVEWKCGLVRRLRASCCSRHASASPPARRVVFLSAL